MQQGMKRSRSKDAMTVDVEKTFPASPRREGPKQGPKEEAVSSADGPSSKRTPRKLKLHRFGYTTATPSKQRAGCLRMQSDTQCRASIKMGSKASAEQGVDSELDGSGS